MARFTFDADMCTKCHACEVACAMWHGADAASGGFRRIIEVETGSFPQVERSFETKILPGCDLCCNCGGPRCAQTCPTGALRFS